jgi:hypothetical protein
MRHIINGIKFLFYSFLGLYVLYYIMMLCVHKWDSDACRFHGGTYVSEFRFSSNQYPIEPLNYKCLDHPQILKY